jgi:hypothetical protein
VDIDGTGCGGDVWCSEQRGKQAHKVSGTFREGGARIRRRDTLGHICLLAQTMRGCGHHGTGRYSHTSRNHR